MSNVVLTTVPAPPVPQEVLLLRNLVGLAALGRAPPRPWHLEAAPAVVAQCSAGEGGFCGKCGGGRGERERESLFRTP
jgi:hypothetical protein